jgi:8-oxo-dGTP diphosphatase
VIDGGTIAVAVVVLNGRVLVGRRAHDAVDSPGRHEFPGGKVEPGESPAMAAARECLEESGVGVRVGALVDRVSGESTRGPLEILFFAAVPLGGPGDPRAPFEWMPIDALPACSFPPANARVLAALANGETGRGSFAAG